ncbi:MAG: hypothetical protein KA180_15375, partial [Gemmatimonadales bacterium]|nr:hypothetical protein [Gemmatimonadales bacterium]
MTLRLTPSLAACGLLLLAAAAPRGAAAQDTLRPPDGVRIGIEYRPGVRPAIVVLPTRGLDSVRAIVTRDLDFSDRFEVIPLAAGDSAAVAANAGGRTVNYPLFRTLG